MMCLVLRCAAPTMCWGVCGKRWRVHCLLWPGISVLTLNWHYTLAHAHVHTHTHTHTRTHTHTHTHTRTHTHTHMCTHSMAAYFVGWRQQAALQREMRERLWPKVRAWRAYIVAQKTRREAFRLCFWPFHVWRRETWANALARDKARFLVRVYREVLKLRHLHAWRR